MQRRVILGFLAALALGGVAAAKQIAPAALPQTGEQLQRATSLSGTSGWMLVDLDSGEVLDAGNADRGFVPASVAKLPTAAFALDALGPAHRFRTALLGTGGVAGGRLAGDLYLRGGGDPELDTDALAVLVDRLGGAGLREARGRFFVDGAALPQLPEIEPAQGDDASYNPSLSGLNLNFNRVHVKWDARGQRRNLSVEAEATRLSPVVEGVQVTLNDSPGAPLFRHRMGHGGEHWQMARRAFRGRGARWLPVKRPEIYAGEVFRTLARRAVVGLALPETGHAPADALEIAAVESRPLGELIRDMLRYSTNITAEALGTAASRATGRQVASLPASAAILNDWAASVGGFPSGDAGFALANHSGLTLDSRVSPRRMTDLLAGLARRGADPLAAHPRLPGRIAGYLKPYSVEDKTFPLDYARLDVVAKTGTINYVRGLAGYIATPGGRRLAFAIFSNDLARRSGGAENVDKGWMGRARAFERALIRNWVLRFDRG